MPLESTDENEILFQQKLPPGDEWLTRKSDEISKEDQLTLLRAYKSGDIDTYNETRDNIRNNLLFEFGEVAADVIMAAGAGVGLVGIGARALGRAAVKAVGRAATKEAAKKAYETEIPPSKNQKTLEKQAKDAKDALEKETPQKQRPLKKLKEKEEAIRKPKEEERVPKEEERLRKEEEERLRKEEEERLRKEEEERVRKEEEERVRKENKRTPRKRDKKGKIPKGPLAGLLPSLLNPSGDDDEDYGSIEGLSAIESTIPISTISGGDTGMVGEGSFGGEEGASSKTCLEALNKIHRVLIESKNINEKMSQDMAFFAKQSAHADILGDLESANQSVRSTKNNEGRGYTGRRERSEDTDKESNLLQKVARGVVGIAGALAALGLGAIAGNDNGEESETAEKTNSQPFELSDEIGSIAEKYESSNRGAGTISSGEGDIGGKSYGKHQLSSNAGTLTDYIKSSEYSKQFEGLEPGSEKFDEKWKELANTDENFAKEQKTYIQKTHYDPTVRKLQKSGIDLSKKGRAVQEALFSTSVGLGAGLAPNAIKNALKGQDPEMMSDAEIVSAIQDYKIENVSSLYKSSPESTQRKMVKRAQEEKQDLLKIAEMPQTISPNSESDNLAEKIKPNDVEERPKEEIKSIEKIKPNENHTESEITSETTSGGGSTTFTKTSSPKAQKLQNEVEEKQQNYDNKRTEVLQRIHKENPNIGIQESIKLADEETFQEKKELDLFKDTTKKDIANGTTTNIDRENSPTVTKTSNSGDFNEDTLTSNEDFDGNPPKSETIINADQLGPHDVVLFDDNEQTTEKLKPDLNHTESETTSETTSGGGSTTTTVSHSPLAIQQQKIVDEKQAEYDKIRSEAFEKVKKENPDAGFKQLTKLADEETFREKRELDEVKEATAEDIKSGTGTNTTWQDAPTVTKISKSGYSDETDEMKAKLAVLNTPEAIEERKKDPDHLAEVERQKSSYYKQKEPESKEIPIYQESELNTKLPSDYVPNKNRIPSKDPGFEVDVETGEEFLNENSSASPIFDESGSSLPSINETQSEIPAAGEDDSRLNSITDMFSDFGTMISGAIGTGGGEKSKAPSVVPGPAQDSAGGGGAMMNVRNDDPLLLTLQYGNLRTI